jgi:glycosyltransferase involved in cell wall biosynthesis
MESGGLSQALAHNMAETFVHVLDSISNEASGPSYSVPRLCEALALQGATLRLLTVGENRSRFIGVRHEVYPANFASVPILGQLRFSRALKGALNHFSKTATIIHTHGLWRMPNVYPASAAVLGVNHLVLSPRGMLGGAALKFSSFKKKMFWAVAQGAAARAASCIHATSPQEYDDIRAFGLKTPIAIIPNGIDVPTVVSKELPTGGRRTVLYLGRLHPKKGLDWLLDAWDLIEVHHPDWHLDIVGPIDSDYAQMLKLRSEANGPASRVRFLGPLYGEQKQNVYRGADLFVLPTLNENFANTVAEALAQGTPVISTKGAPWGNLVSHGCGWWIDLGPEPLAATMDKAMNLPREHLRAMGESGRAWMRRDFDWSAVAQSMRSVYDWLSGQRERPPCVVTD